MELVTLLRITVAILVAATFLSLPLRPLWVDEIYQLQATRDQSFPAMLHSAMVAPGGMPLAYTLQKLWLAIAGFSTTQARVPAVLFGLGSVWALSWVARLLRLDALPVAAAGLATPLLFRYATEARPYSQGLFFSVLATALFLRWWQNPSTARLLAYSLCLVAGIYSQPFSLFVAISHTLFVLTTERRRLFPLLAALAVPCFLYVPWFLLSSQALLHEAWPHLMFFSWRQISPLMILREISGGGYVCSLSLLVAAAFALKRPADRLLVLWAVVPALLAIACDAKFNYFFAIRQLIFILPPLLILAVVGLENLATRHSKVAIVLAAVYMTGALVKDIRWQLDHKEDWAKAALHIRNELEKTDGCVTFLPDRDAPSYYFFQPALRSKNCLRNTAAEPAITAVSPYAESTQRFNASHGENVGNTLILTKSGSR